MYADSASVGQMIAERLGEVGAENLIQEKASTGYQLTSGQKRSNRAISRVRARVKHPFAFMEGAMGGIYQRDIDLKRNRHGSSTVAGASSVSEAMEGWLEDKF